MASLTTLHTLFSSLTVRGKGPSSDRDSSPSGGTSTAVMREGVVSNVTGMGWGVGHVYQISQSHLYSEHVHVSHTIYQYHQLKGTHLPHLVHCEVHSCVVTLHEAYLAVLQLVPPSLWRVPCQQW